MSPDPLARSGLSGLLRAAGVDVAGEADRPPEDGVDPLIWDLGPGGGLTDELDTAGGPILVLTTDPGRAAEALEQGAMGALFRDGDGDRLRVALDAVSAGLTVVDAPFRELLLRGTAARTSAGRGDELTPREREVLGLLAGGLSNRHIARRLRISEHTAKFHVNAVLAKLGANSRTDAVVRAARMGLVSL